MNESVYAASIKNTKALHICLQQPFRPEENHRLLGRKVILIWGSKGNKPLKFFACGVVSGFQLSLESLKALVLLLNMETMLKQNEEIMKNTSVFSVIF